MERFTRVAADTINYEVTLDDPTTWTKPWTAVIRLKQIQAKIHEYACHEGNKEPMLGILAGARVFEKGRRAGRKPSSKQLVSCCGVLRRRVPRSAEPEC